jgi:alpha-galactosidase-like protein
VLGSGCSSVEYGDLFDVMGSASPPKHFNAVQKELLGWLNYGSSPPVTTVQSSGVYTIDPYESLGANPKALKVKTSSGDWYYVEYRQALGFDASSVSSNPNLKNGVVVHLWSQQNPNGVFLLDMTPTTDSWSDPALDVSQQYSDTAAGITISTVWATTTAGVSVTVAGGGGTSCVRHNPTLTVSPAQQQGAPGAAVSYTMSVTNNDVGCSASSFTAQASVPTGWQATFAAAALTIGAGATATTTLQVTSPVSAPAGAYTISPVASQTGAPAYSGSTQVTYTVASTGTGGTFTDDFNRADSNTLGNGWTAQVGDLMIKDQQLRNAETKSMHTAIQAGLVGAIQSVSATFSVVNNNAGPRFGLLARYKDPSNYYTCYRQAGGVSVLRISKMVGGVETMLKAAQVPNPRRGEVFTLGCQIDGTTITLTYNGAVKATAPASEPGLPSGSVGITMGYPAVRGGGAAQSHSADDFSATAH